MCPLTFKKEISFSHKVLATHITYSSKFSPPQKNVFIGAKFQITEYRGEGLGQTLLTPHGSLTLSEEWIIVGLGGQEEEREGELGFLCKMRILC